MLTARAILFLLFSAKIHSPPPPDNKPPNDIQFVNKGPIEQQTETQNLGQNDQIGISNAAQYTITHLSSHQQHGSDKADQKPSEFRFVLRRINLQPEPEEPESNIASGDLSGKTSEGTNENLPLSSNIKLEPEEIKQEMSSDISEDDSDNASKQTILLGEVRPVQIESENEDFQDSHYDQKMDFASSPSPIPQRDLMIPDSNKKNLDPIVKIERLNLKEGQTYKIKEQPSEESSQIKYKIIDRDSDPSDVSRVSEKNSQTFQTEPDTISQSMGGVSDSTVSIDPTHIEENQNALVDVDSLNTLERLALANAISMKKAGVDYLEIWKKQQANQKNSSSGESETNTGSQSTENDDGSSSISDTGADSHSTTGTKWDKDKVTRAMLHAFVELYKQRVFPRYRMKPGFVIDGKALPDEQYAEKIVEHRQEKWRENTSQYRQKKKAVDDTDFHPSGNNENDQQAGTSVAQMSPAEIIMNLQPEEHRMLQRFAKRHHKYILSQKKIHPEKDFPILDDQSAPTQNDIEENYVRYLLENRDRYNDQARDKYGKSLQDLEYVLNVIKTKYGKIQNYEQTRFQKILADQDKLQKHLKASSQSKKRSAEKKKGTEPLKQKTVQRKETSSTKTSVAIATTSNSEEISKEYPSDINMDAVETNDLPNDNDQTKTLFLSMPTIDEPEYSADIKPTTGTYLEPKQEVIGTVKEEPFIPIDVKNTNKLIQKPDTESSRMAYVVDPVTTYQSDEFGEYQPNSPNPPDDYTSSKSKGNDGNLIPLTVESYMERDPNDHIRYDELTELDKLAVDDEQARQRKRKTNMKNRLQRTADQPKDSDDGSQTNTSSQSAEINDGSSDRVNTGADSSVTEMKVFKKSELTRAILEQCRERQPQVLQKYRQNGYGVRFGKILTDEQMAKQIRDDRKALGNFNKQQYRSRKQKNDDTETESALSTTDDGTTSNTEKTSQNVQTFKKTKSDKPKKPVDSSSTSSHEMLLPMSENSSSGTTVDTYSRPSDNYAYYNAQGTSDDLMSNADIVKALSEEDQKLLERFAKRSFRDTINTNNYRKFQRDLKNNPQMTVEEVKNKEPTPQDLLERYVGTILSHPKTLNDLAKIVNINGLSRIEIVEKALHMKEANRQADLKKRRDKRKRPVLESEEYDDTESEPPMKSAKIQQTDQQKKQKTVGRKKNDSAPTTTDNSQSSETVGISQDDPARTNIVAVATNYAPYVSPTTSFNQQVPTFLEDEGITPDATLKKNPLSLTLDDILPDQDVKSDVPVSTPEGIANQNVLNDLMS